MRPPSAAPGQAPGTAATSTGNATITHPCLTGARCRCSGCGQNFNNVSAFDARRSGTYWPTRRVCLTPKQMRARGMSLNAAGLRITETREERAGSRGRAGRSGDRIKADHLSRGGI